MKAYGGIIPADRERCTTVSFSELVRNGGWFCEAESKYVDGPTENSIGDVNGEACSSCGARRTLTYIPPALT